MSFFFGNDLWDEMSRMQKQLDDLTWEMDYKRPKIEGTKNNKSDKGGKCVTPFKKEMMCECFNPVTDLAENEDNYVVSMDLPGVKKEELNVTVHNGVLTVSGTRRHKFESKEEDDDDESGESEKKEGEKKEEKKEVKDEEKKEGEKKVEEKKPKHRVIRMESYYGSFERSVSVPFGTTTDDVKAKFEDGVLTITIAKHKKDSIKKIEIQ